MGTNLRKMRRRLVQRVLAGDIPRGEIYGLTRGEITARDLL